MNTRSLLIIDPSSIALGWALFELNPDLKYGVFTSSGHLKSTKKKEFLESWHDEHEIEHDDWIFNTDYMLLGLLNLLDSFGSVDKCIIEMPSTYQAGVGAVASASGSVMKLMGTVMAIRESLLHAEIDVELVGVSVWKGQQSKEMTARRIKRHWGLEVKDHNEADAIAIGDWYVRKFLKYSIA